jgi:Rrf2 family protein
VQPITNTSAYAIRALTYLAQHHREGLQLGSDMAVELGLPAQFLVKILQPLVAGGLLRSQRGRNGGFELALAPERVSLFKIVDALENLGSPRQCVLGQSECTDERACPLHAFWKRASGEFGRTLATTTLADVVGFCERKPASGYPGPAPVINVRARRRAPATSRRRKTSR